MMYTVTRATMITNSLLRREGTTNASVAEAATTICLSGCVIVTKWITERLTERRDQNGHFKIGERQKLRQRKEGKKES